MSLSPRPLRCVIVTNVPAPYRLPMWEALASDERIELHMVYCSGSHIDPAQDGRSPRYQVHFLTGKYVAREAGFSHADTGVWRLLSSLKPDVVVTSGFIPTFLMAFAWAVAHRVPHVPMTDGTLESERVLGWKHRLVRRLVFACSSAFIGASEGSRALYRSYGVQADHVHLAPLCADNERFAPRGEDKVHDLLFCGRYIELKHPLFAIDVAQGLAKRLGRRVSLRFVGKGPLEAQLRQRAAELADELDISFAGYLSQAELPLEYRRSRLFVFPTAFDVWGVVGNEACAAGLPCIVSPHAGVVGELIRDGRNGHVCALDVPTWVARCAELLDDPARWQAFSQAALQAVAPYTFQAAARGVASAVQQATQHRKVVTA